MNSGVKGISKAIRPMIGSAKTINNWARIGSALISLTIGISMSVSTFPGDDLQGYVTPRACLLTVDMYHLMPAL